MTASGRRLAEVEDHWWEELESTTGEEDNDGWWSEDENGDESCMMGKKDESGEREESGDDSDGHMGKEDWIGRGDIVLDDLEADEPLYKRAEDCAEAEEEEMDGREDDSTLAQDEVNASMSGVTEVCDDVHRGNGSTADSDQRPIPHTREHIADDSQSYVDEKTCGISEEQVDRDHTRRLSTISDMERLDVKPKVHPLRPKTAANRVGICIGGSEVRNVSPVRLNSSARANRMGNWTGVSGGESHKPYTIRQRFVNVLRRLFGRNKIAAA